MAIFIAGARERKFTVDDMGVNKNYLNTAKRRFEINKAGWKASQRLFNSTRREYRGVEIGHRWSLYGYSKLDGLYEITNINRSKMDGKVYFTVKKVLKKRRCLRKPASTMKLLLMT